MAKSLKSKPESLTEPVGEELTESEDNPIYIPDMPAQGEVFKKDELDISGKDLVVEHHSEPEWVGKSTHRLPEDVLFEKSLPNLSNQREVMETEIEFLKRILNIQESGGFGRHLDKVINERIKLLQ